MNTKIIEIIPLLQVVSSFYSYTSGIYADNTRSNYPNHVLTGVGYTPTYIIGTPIYKTLYSSPMSLHHLLFFPQPSPLPSLYITHILSSYFVAFTLLSISQTSQWRTVGELTGEQRASLRWPGTGTDVPSTGNILSFLAKNTCSSWDLLPDTISTSPSEIQVTLPWPLLVLLTLGLLMLLLPTTQVGTTDPSYRPFFQTLLIVFEDHNFWTSLQP